MKGQINFDYILYISTKIIYNKPNFKKTYKPPVFFNLVAKQQKYNFWFRPSYLNNYPWRTSKNRSNFKYI